jgi:hypothetical protein
MSNELKMLHPDSNQNFKVNLARGGCSQNVRVRRNGARRKSGRRKRVGRGEEGGIEPPDRIWPEHQLFLQLQLFTYSNPAVYR